MQKAKHSKKQRCRETEPSSATLWGDPKPELTSKIADALIQGGVDILELGLPFSNPIADGPTIQAASVRALAAGTTPLKVLEIAKEIRQSHDVPVVIMTYYNSVFRMGLERFFRLAKECLVDGVIVPDLPVEEADDCKKTASKFSTDTIFLVTPSTSDERLAKQPSALQAFCILFPTLASQAHKQWLKTPLFS
jgi:tryptophan synthase alpha chain